MVDEIFFCYRLLEFFGKSVEVHSVSDLFQEKYSMLVQYSSIILVVYCHINGRLTSPFGFHLFFVIAWT